MGRSDHADEARSNRRRIAALSALVVLLATLLTGHQTARAESADQLASPTGGTFVFSGGGWGHGVGISQYGLLGRANAGHTAAQMLAAYYAGTKLETVGASTNIRVQLANANTVGLTPAAPVKVLVDGTQVGTGPVGVPFTVNYTGSLISVVAPSIGCNPGSCVGSDVRVPLSAGNPVGVSTTQHRYHRGRLQFLPAGSTMQLTVAGLPMQGYLYGIAEVPKSWPGAALRAQAIAARTYAEDRIRSRRASGASFDLYATTSDQNYTGYENEVSASVDRWFDAVNATDNRMVTYQGAPINALYSSSNGGHSEDSGYVFVTSLPFLKAAPDPFDDTPSNPNHEWKREYSVDQLSSWLGASSDTRVGEVRSITVVSGRGASGRVDKADVRIVGSDRTVTVSGARLRSAINARAGSAQLLSTKFTISGGVEPDTRPFGNFDRTIIEQNGVRLVGWAIDRDRPGKSVNIHAYVGDRFVGKAWANRRRNDIDRRFGLGNQHGFSFLVDLEAGTHRVCAYAINAGPGKGNTGLGCETVRVTDTRPFGNIDKVARNGERASVSGWAIDRDRPGSSVGIHVYVDGRFDTKTTARLSRPDVGRVHGLGNNHGFKVETSRLALGRHQICTYAINAGPGRGNSGLGCRTVTISDSRPIGNFDRVEARAGRIKVSGWAIDPDRQRTAVDIHVYADGRYLGKGTAYRYRPDVGRVHKMGSYHGFAKWLDLTPGRHTVCTYAINAGPGKGNSGLGCRNVTV